MEVASPITFAPPCNKRSLTCSPLADNNLSDMDIVCDERVTKRRRFDTAMEALTDDFSSDFAAQSMFYKSLPNNRALFGNSTALLKRQRPSHQNESNSPAKEELNRVVQEQASLIDSLKVDKVSLEDTLKSMKTDHERVVKENQILRKAVTIQQERQQNAENEIKVVKAQADERIKGLEQMVLSLRYHLAQQNRTVGNDFMHHRPPDVY